MSESYYKHMKDNRECSADLDEALKYALEGIVADKSEFNDFKKNFGEMVVEWFFSGNWIMVCEDEEEDDDDIGNLIDKGYEEALNEELDKGWKDLN